VRNKAAHRCYVSRSIESPSRKSDKVWSSHRGYSESGTEGIRVRITVVAECEILNR